MQNIVETNMLEGAVYIGPPYGGLKRYKRLDIFYEESSQVRTEIGVGEYDNIYYFQFTQISRSLLSLPFICGLFEYSLHEPDRYEGVSSSE